MIEFARRAREVSRFPIPKTNWLRKIKGKGYRFLKRKIGQGKALTVWL